MCLNKRNISVVFKILNYNIFHSLNKYNIERVATLLEDGMAQTDIAQKGALCKPYN